MTLDLRDNYMDGGDPPVEAGTGDSNKGQEWPRPNPKGILKVLGRMWADPELRRSMRETNRANLILVGVTIALLGTAFVYQNRKENAAAGQMGGAECAPVWKEVESELDVMRRLDSRFKEEAASGEMSGYRLKKYENAKAETNWRFSENARVWLNCLERQKQKKQVMKPMKEVAMPKPLPRARTAP